MRTILKIENEAEVLFDILSGHENMRYGTNISAGKSLRETLGGQLDESGKRFDKLVAEEFEHEPHLEPSFTSTELNKPLKLTSTVDSWQKYGGVSLNPTGTSVNKGFANLSAHKISLSFAKKSLILGYRDLHHWPYSPKLWFSRAASMLRFGYGELAFIDAHKVRLLLDAFLHPEGASGMQIGKHSLGVMR